jgi:hypothetical protein
MDPNPLLDGFMTLDEFATSVGRTERTLKRWRKKGLPYVKRGNLILINVERARQWLNAGEVGGTEEPKRRKRNGR